MTINSKGKNDFTKKCFEFYVNVIKKGPLYSKQKEECRDIYEKALYQGYLTASRTFKQEKYTNNVKETVKAIKRLIQASDTEKYDRIHNEACMKFINKQGVTYGQAQKVINMAMKFLLVLNTISKNAKNTFLNKYAKDVYKIELIKDVAKKIDIKCKKCMHMPLDSYILNWYKKYVNCERKTKKIVWSKIKDFEEYKTIRDDIRNHKKKSNCDVWDDKKSVIENEFNIWANIKESK